MKEKIISVFKEIGIALVMIVILGAVTVVAFYNKIPYGKEIPKGEEYVKANKEEYSVSSHDRLAEVKAITVTHEADSTQITNAENDVRLTTGKDTPFGTISSTSDLPSEKVGTVIEVPNTSAIASSSSSSALSESVEKFEERIQYPDTSGDSE